MKKIYFWVMVFPVTVYFLGSPTFSLASEQVTIQEAKDKTEAHGIEEALAEGFDYSLRVLGFGTFQNVANSSQNPNNDFFQIPRYGAEVDLRPDARLKLWRFGGSIKPRLNLTWQAWEDRNQAGDTLKLLPGRNGDGFS